MRKLLQNQLIFRKTKQRETNFSIQVEIIDLKNTLVTKFVVYRKAQDTTVNNVR